MKSYRLSSRIILTKCNKEVFDSLPPNMRVDGGFWVWGNQNLTSLPPELKVSWWLYLSDCANLKSLPEGLEVGGDLNLSGCTSLTSLPEGLEVGGDLDIEGCESLESLLLLEDLQVKGTIWYNSKTGFTQIEGWEDDPTIIPTHLRGKLRKL